VAARDAARHPHRTSSITVRPFRRANASTQQDLHATAVYLKDLPAKASPGDAGKPPSDVLARGEGVYLDRCTGCYMEQG
jgi:hypothetical protein